MAGMFVVGIAGDAWYLMMVGMIAWSTGSHLAMPIRRSIAMQLAQENAKGRRLGQVGAVALAATIGGCLIV